MAGSAGIVPFMHSAFDEFQFVVVVAVVHAQLADLAEQALHAGANVLVEKPAGMSTAQIDRLIESAELRIAGRDTEEIVRVTRSPGR